MQITDFDYALPAHLIAQAPAPARDGSRLLIVGPRAVEHARFPAVLGCLQRGDVLVVNDTRVVPARLFVQKDSGGRAELLLERIESERVAVCQVRVSKSLKPGRALLLGAERVEVLGREDEFYRLRFPRPVLEVLEQRGEMPLPPYIERAATTSDRGRYQTVYASTPGAVAAPTAGLHFTDDMLSQIRALGVEIVRVTLHVGAGTFQPVRVARIADHHMHAEHYAVGDEAAAAINACRARGGRVVAVGTTVVRTLESAGVSGVVVAGSAPTRLFITPGYRFQVVDALITNFHLPRSTLLMLVSAFAGYRRIRAAYVAAVRNQYRFFSYGDAMFLRRMEEDLDADVLEENA
ncbi:MAG: tRNA preQ1(34) S-adenosylmethionine ribosyltransferase-isomerase QueA [Pseudomonadales bacterium]